GSPLRGFSIFTTSAPSQASASVQVGPASNWVRATTRTPFRQFSGAKFPLIPCVSSYGGISPEIPARQDTAERRPTEIADFREQACIALAGLCEGNPGAPASSRPLGDAERRRPARCRRSQRSARPLQPECSNKISPAPIGAL